MEAASLPLITTRPRVLAGVKARRVARRAARLMADADRFERAAARLEAQVGADAWQVKHLYRSSTELRRLAGEEAARLAPSAAAD
ncbi:MAG: hypothetical protein QOF55_2497 [Thermoleophilaceae bacterium]|nr:hypothetical protein [Thermoleophilaceae bacterium]